MRVRVYGDGDGNDSFSRVTQGMLLGLEKNNVLAGHFPLNWTNTIDEDGASGEGHDADVGVFVGDFRKVGLMRSMGWHKERLVLLPVNSSWCPHLLLSTLEQTVTGYIAPSTWAQQVLQGYTKLPVYLWQHGVSESIAYTSPSLHGSSDFEQIIYNFRVGHFSSSTFQRKGTDELVRAWVKVYGKTIPALTSKLFISSPRPERYEHVPGVESVGRLGFVDTIFLQSFELVAQPSRGEGFGMIPLEARAGGTRVAATACTGHADHFDIKRHCASHHVLIKHGPDEVIDDGPGAMAPSLDVDEIAVALTLAYKTKDMVTDAMRRADQEYVMENWSWKKTTKEWLSRWT